MPSNVPVGTFGQVGQKVNDLYDLVGMLRREIKRKSVKEREDFERVAKRQKVRVN